MGSVTAILIQTSLWTFQFFLWSVDRSGGMMASGNVYPLMLLILFHFFLCVQFRHTYYLASPPQSGGIYCVSWGSPHRNIIGSHDFHFLQKRMHNVWCLICSYGPKLARVLHPRFCRLAQYLNTWQDEWYSHWNKWFIKKQAVLIGMHYNS